MAKGCLIGCLGTIGAFIVLMVVLVAVSMVSANMEAKADGEVLAGFMNSAQNGDTTKAYAVLDPVYRNSFSREEFEALLASVRLADAKNWEKEYFANVDDAAVYEIKVHAPGAPPLPFYAHIRKRGDERVITLLTREKPMVAGKVSYSSTTTITKQLMKSPLQQIYISDSREKLAGSFPDDSWDHKVGPTDLYCRLEFRGAQVGAKLKISWKAELQTDWGPEMVELGPLEHALEHRSGWLPFSVTHGETPFPAGKHRVEVFLGEKRLGMKEFTISP
jgi:hypothetical protein